MDAHTLYRLYSLYGISHLEGQCAIASSAILSDDVVVTEMKSKGDLEKLYALPNPSMILKVSSTDLFIPCRYRSS
jgi:hypothetical protein